MHSSHAYPFSRVAFVGNYLPRRCGIATFTTDLCESVAQMAPGLDCMAVAMNDTPEGYAYPDRVRFETAQNDLDGYRQLAEFLNMGQVDLVCVQHEYGIFGGPAGGHLLATLRSLRMPVVATLHTVLKEPGAEQRQVLEEVCRLSERVVVMSEKARNFLGDIYRVPAAKVDLIHHGIPDMPFVDPNYYKDLFGVEGRRTILTFGLLSPNKGIEYMIDALPEIVRNFPDVMYLVLGVTHPHVKREHGEEYRLGLQRRAKDLGVAEHLAFHNRFVELEELCRFLGAADVYVTPYLNPAQITSGTLAYSMGTGKAVVSTPYWYAEELLAEGRGRIAPFRDSGAFARIVVELFKNEAERHAMRKQAYAFGRKMIWPEVAKVYLDCFRRATEERQRAPSRVVLAKAAERFDMELPDLNPSHMLVLTDDTGILQHAHHTVPNLSEGYTTDDNARALIVAVQAEKLGKGGERFRHLAAKYLAFIDFAFNRGNGRFRNFLGYDRHWLEAAGSEDSHGRAIWGLGCTIGISSDDGMVALAMNLFEAALPAIELFTSPRAWAFALLGICAYVRRFPGDTRARHLRDALAHRLHELYRANAKDDWLWFERSLAYANARLSQALIVAGKGIGDADMLAVGLKSLEWLLDIQTAEGGHFSSVGNSGWHRDGPRPKFDQQPIEAQSMLEASLDAYRATGDGRWYERMRRVFQWFLGYNDLGRAVYDDATGGCHDGLHHEGVNVNEGAESTLAFLSSLLAVRAAEASIPEEAR